MMTMMDIALLGSAVISWFAVGLALLVLARQRKHSRTLDAQYQHLLQELKLAGNGNISMGQRLLIAEKTLCSTGEQLAELQQQFRDQSVQAAARPVALHDYEDAAQLLARGASADEVAKRCGLGKAEASLMAALKRSGQPLA